KAAGPIEIVGCTTAGEITEAGVIHDGIAVLIVSSDSSSAVASFASGLRESPARVAEDLSRSASAMRRTAASRGLRQSTTVLLTDGLSGTGERLVINLHDRGQPGSQIVGGAAGDEGKFKLTQVGTGQNAASDSAVAMHVVGERKWGVG